MIFPRRGSLKLEAMTAILMQAIWWYVYQAHKWRIVLRKLRRTSNINTQHKIYTVGIFETV